MSIINEEIIISPWLGISRVLCDQYQLDSSYEVVMLGNKLEEIESEGVDVPDIAAGLINDGYTELDAMEAAIARQVTVSMAPKGFMFARLEAKGKKPITVMCLRSELKQD